MNAIGDRGGSAFITSMVLGCVLCFIVGSYLFLVSTSAKMVTRQNDFTRAFYLAEAGAERGKGWLSVEVQSRTGYYYQSETIEAEDILGASFVNLGERGTYTVHIDPDPDNFVTPQLPLYTIVATGTYDPDGVAGSGDEISRSITVNSQVASFARYAYFSDYEPSNIWFFDHDLIRGPLHSNSKLKIAYDPHFEGYVTSTSDYFRFYNYGSSFDSTQGSNPPRDEPIFEEGYSLGFHHIAYPDDVSDIEAAAHDGGLAIDDDTAITLNGDGSLTYGIYHPASYEYESHRHRHGGWGDRYHHGGTYHYYRHTHTHTHQVLVEEEWWEYVDVELSDLNGAVHVDGDVDVSGTLSGQLTIAAEGDIHIVDDVLYSTNPVDYDGDGLVNDGNNNGINDPAHGNAPADDTDDDNDGIPDDEDTPVPLGDDKLGLVAEGNVIVDDDGEYERVDRTICATIMALDTSFYVEDYRDHVEGELTIIGGLIQAQRGAVGTFSGDNKTGGFSKNYIYDHRCTTAAPPWFPPTGLMDVIFWHEHP